MTGRDSEEEKGVGVEEEGSQSSKKQERQRLEKLLSQYKASMDSTASPSKSSCKTCLYLVLCFLVVVIIMS